MRMSPESCLENDKIQCCSWMIWSLIDESSHERTGVVDH
jgi:hypothetical protein